MVKSWCTAEGGGSEYKVKVTVTGGVLSFNCDDCFSAESLGDEYGDEMGQLCVHAAAIAMATAEANAL